MSKQPEDNYNQTCDAMDQLSEHLNPIEAPRMPSCVRPYLVTIRAIVIDHDFTDGTGIGSSTSPEDWDLQALYEEIDRAGGLIDVEAVELVPKVTP